MTIAGSASSEPVSVEVADCGRTIIVHVPQQGHTLRLVQSALNADQFTDTVMIEGYASHFTLVRQDHLGLSGSYNVSTSEAALNADVTVSLDETSAPDMDGCFDDPEPEFERRDTSLAQAALADALQAKGLTLPAGYQFADFIAAEIDTHGDMQATYVLLDANGDIVPLTRTEAVAQICEPDEDAPAPLEATHVLRFKVFSFERTTTAFAQRMRIYGNEVMGVIVEQREGAVAGQNQSSAESAILEAISQLSSQPGALIPNPQ